MKLSGATAVLVISAHSAAREVVAARQLNRVRFGLRRLLLAALLAMLPVLSALPALAGSQPLVNDNDRVTLHGNVYPLARPEFDVGSTPATLPMNRIILALKMRPEKQAEQACPSQRR
jgi:hypothetical protein